MWVGLRPFIPLSPCPRWGWQGVQWNWEGAVESTPRHRDRESVQLWKEALPPVPGTDAGESEMVNEPSRSLPHRAAPSSICSKD